MVKIIDVFMVKNGEKEIQIILETGIKNGEKEIQIILKNIKENIERRRKMKKCKWCKKKLEGQQKKYCSSKCKNKIHYRKNKKYYQKYYLKYRHDYKYSFCKCGNKKGISSKQCRKCYHSNKHKSQLSRIKSK